MSISSDKFLPDLMHDIKKASHSYFNDVLKDENITSAQVFYLMMLNKHNSLSQKELSSIAQCDKAHTNRIITQLFESKLIKAVEPAVMRNQELCLTEKGELLAKKVELASKKWLKIITNDITDEELEITHRTAFKMLENAKKYKCEVKK